MKKLFLLFAVAAMASCSKSELATRPVSDDNVEITAGSTILSIDTKTPYEGNLETIGGPVEALVYAVMEGETTYTDAGVYAKGYMTFTRGASGVSAVGFQNWNSSLSPTPGLDNDPKYYPAGDKELTLTAFSPVAPSADGDGIWTNTAGTISAKITGNNDLMFDWINKMPDGIAMISKGSAKASPTQYPTFTFEHQLTLVNIKVKGDDAAIVKSWGDITGIELTGVWDKEASVMSTSVNNKINVVLGSTEPTPTFTVSSEAGFLTNTPFFIYESSAYTDKIVNDTNIIPIPHEAVSDIVAYSMIAPFTVVADKDVMKLLVKTKNEGAGVPVTVKFLGTESSPFAGDTKGKKFDLTLTFKGKEITATAKVIQWDPIDNGDVTVE